ncbi:MAG: PAS domain-containing protein, partial [Dokdonella sp.]
QIQAVRLLISQHQLDMVKVTVKHSKEPVLIAAADSRVLYSNDMFDKTVSLGQSHFVTLDELAGAFTEPDAAYGMLKALREQGVPWRGELCFLAGASKPVPVGIRADVVVGPHGDTLGYMLIFVDLNELKNTENARRELDNALYLAGRSASQAGTSDSSRSVRDEVIGAIHANTRMAALDIVDGVGSTAVASIIDELQEATQRATSIYGQLRVYARDRE